MFCAELCGTTRNFFSFFELGGSLCFAQATECGGTSHLAVNIEPGQGHYPTERETREVIIDSWGYHPA